MKGKAQHSSVAVRPGVTRVLELLSAGQVPASSPEGLSLFVKVSSEKLYSLCRAYEQAGMMLKVSDIVPEQLCR